MVDVKTAFTKQPPITMARVPNIRVAMELRPSSDDTTAIADDTVVSEANPTTPKHLQVVTMVCEKNKT